MDICRVLAGSPVCQKPEILEEFLKSLKNLKRDTLQLDYIFVDDNRDPLSSGMLKNFEREGASVTILPGGQQDSYKCDESTHHWNDSLMLRVGEWKNRIIRYALEQGYDALFLVDSDLILHPGLLEHLKGRQKHVISEIFWTSWHPGQPKEPNLWLFDEYDFARRSPGEEIDAEEVKRRGHEFLEQLKVPGVYEVGGLGACTLISREALQKGVDFSYIPNLTIHGEDRFFCIRAAVLGIGLYADTAFPAFHIYRPSDLKRIPDLSGNAPAMEKHQRVILSMTVRNEEGRYLERVLNGARGYIDGAVIIDDASDDGTAAICECLLDGIPHRIIHNETPMFANEVELRKKQWEETVSEDPDWILCLDADEVPEEDFWIHLREMTEDARYDQYGFRLYDMWNEEKYREDAYWNAHKRSSVFLLRHRPDMICHWKETPQHCGRFPDNLEDLARHDSKFRIRHFGWARPEDRKIKYDRYRLLDPEAIYGVRRQYDSILDSYPKLVSWREKEGERDQK